MSGHTQHEKSEQCEGGTTAPRAADRPLPVRPPPGRKDEADGPTAPKGQKIRLEQPMQGNLQTVQGIPHILDRHPEVETRPPDPCVSGSLGGSSQRCPGTRDRGRVATGVLRQPNSPLGRD